MYVENACTYIGNDCLKLTKNAHRCVLSVFACVSRESGREKRAREEERDRGRVGKREKESKMKRGRERGKGACVR